MTQSPAFKRLLLSTSAIALAACGEDPADVANYRTVEACVADRGDQALCQRAFDDALTQHASQAPVYATLAACEAVHGPGVCAAPDVVAPGRTVAEPSQGGGGVFLPFMLGYLMGGGPGAGAFSTAPYTVFRGGNQSRSGPVFARSSSRPPDVSRPASGKSVLPAPTNRSRAVSTSGFGARAFSRGGGFGG